MDKKFIGAYVDLKLVSELKRKCQALDLSMSQLIRKMVREFLTK